MTLLFYSIMTRYIANKSLKLIKLMNKHEKNKQNFIQFTNTLNMD